MATNVQSNETPGTPYVPNEYYDCTRGITLATWESAQGCAKAVPFEEGFMADPSALHRAIGAVNISGQDLTVVWDREKRVNKNLPAARENEREINGFFLPNGSSSHASVPPYCFHITVTEFVESEQGGKKRLTRQGFPMASVQNKVITYNPGEAEGLVTDLVATAHLGHFAWVVNNTDNTLGVDIGKSATAYAQSQAQIRESKMDRAPDRGAEIVERVEIKPGGTWHFKTPPRIYTVRALEPPTTMDGVDSIMGDNSRVPADTDYVELASTNARAGQIVIFFADAARQGFIKAKAFNSGECKLVSDTILQNTRNPSE